MYIEIYSHVGTLNFIVHIVVYIICVKRHQRSGSRCEIRDQKYDLRLVQ